MNADDDLICVIRVHLRSKHAVKFTVKFLTPS